ncbi:MAG: hypothetical protein V2G48_02535 [bacterium JZ-2024 1]
MRLFLPFFLLVLLPSTALAQLFQIEFQAKTLQTLDEEKVVFGSDGVTLSFLETKIEADEVLVFREEARILCQGNVRMSRPGVGVLASSMLVDFTSGYFEMEQPSGFFSMEEFTYELLYFTGSRLRGDPNRFLIEDAVMTSCSANCPREYHLKASKVSVKPGKLMEAWNATFYIAGIPLLFFPYFVTDLKRRETGVDFLIGKNKTEGWFFRSNYTFLNKVPLIAAVTFDWMQKTGNKYGLSYQNKLKWFGDTQPGKYSYSSNENKRSRNKNTALIISQPFKWGNWMGNFDYNRTFQYTQFNYGTGRTETKRWGVKLNAPKGLGNFEYSQNEQGSGINRTGTSNLTLRFPKFHLFFLPASITFTGNRNKTGKNPSDDEGLLTITTQSQKARGIFSSWNLKWERKFDLDGSSYTQDNRVQLSDRLPEFTAMLNPKIFQGTFLGKSLFLSSGRLSISRWQQGPRSSPKKSSFAELTLEQGKQWSFWNKAVQFTWRQSFAQTFFTTKDAKYSFRPSLNLDLNPMKIWNIKLGYTYSKERGGNPFATPLNGNQENLTVNSTFAKGKKWQFTSGTSYDLKSKRRQPISLSLRLNPSRNSLLNMSSSYNRITRDFGNISVQYNLTKVPRTAFNFSLNYDSIKHKITQFNYQLNQQLPKGFFLSSKSAYNRPRGFRLFQEIILRKQNCCTYWQLSWNYLNKQILFNWGITAFPHDFFRLSHGNEGTFLNTFAEEYLQKGFGTGMPTTPPPR